MVDHNLLGSFFYELKHNWDNYHLELGSGISIYNIDNSEFEISPREFLFFAETDIQQQNKHGLVNSISNVKRSLECQTDVIFSSLRIPYSNKRFPLKIEILKEMGITSPQIINVINKNRVALEHSYKCPTEEQVKIGIDVANLFLDASTFPLKVFWSEFLLIPNESDDDTAYKNGIKIDFNNNESTYKIENRQSGQSIGLINISSDQLDDFKKLVKMSVKIGKNVDHYDNISGSTFINELFSD